LAVVGGFFQLVAAALFVYLKIVAPERFQSEPYQMGYQGVGLGGSEDKGNAVSDCIP
jgi:hypothetical protein